LRTHLVEADDDAVGGGSDLEVLDRPLVAAKDDVSQLTQSHIDVDARGVKNPPPLPASGMRLDEECLAGKAPGRGKILLCLLTPTLEVLELTGQVVREVSSETRVTDERIDVLAYEQG
jgi:hypothetical protein